MGGGESVQRTSQNDVSHKILIATIPRKPLILGVVHKSNLVTPIVPIVLTTPAPKGSCKRTNRNAKLRALQRASKTNVGGNPPPKKPQNLTLGFAQVQGMIRHGHSESFSGIDVSSRVVVTLGVFVRGSFCCRPGWAGEEDHESSAVEKLLLRTNARGKLHCVAGKARTTRYNYLDKIRLLPFPPLLL